MNQSTFHRHPGIIRFMSQQAHIADATTSSAQPSYASTTVKAVMHTLSMAISDDQLYMDTGATSHMTANRDNLTFLFQCEQYIILLSVMTIIFQLFVM
jgi:hypothetical protein